MSYVRTMADAVIVVALLLFIVGWVALWALTWDHADSEAVKDGWTAFWVLVVVAGPPLWAGRLVRKVVGG